MRYATIYFMLFIFLAMLSSCKTVTKYVPVESVRTEYREADTTAFFNRLMAYFESRREKESRSDSLLDRSSEKVVVNENGDTLKHEKERTIYRATAREKELETENKTLRDSVSVLNTRLESIKTDSAPVIVPVERELSRWEKAKMDFGGMAMVGATVFFIGLCIAVIWLIKKNKK